MKRTLFSARVSVLALLALSLCQCARVTHDQRKYPGEVYLTPPPAGVADPARLKPFRVSDTHVRFLECVPLYCYSLDKSLGAVNPHRFPIYNVDCGEDFEFWEFFFLAADIAMECGFPDTRTVVLKGDVLAPANMPDWAPTPADPWFGPRVWKVDAEGN